MGKSHYTVYRREGENLYLSLERREKGVSRKKKNTLVV